VAYFFILGRKEGISLFPQKSGADILIHIFQNEKIFKKGKVSVV